MVSRYTKYFCEMISILIAVTTVEQAQFGLKQRDPRSKVDFLWTVRWMVHSDKPLCSHSRYLVIGEDGGKLGLHRNSTPASTAHRMNMSVSLLNIWISFDCSLG